MITIQTQIVKDWIDIWDDGLKLKSLPREPEKMIRWLRARLDNFEEAEGRRIAEAFNEEDCDTKHDKGE